MEFHKAIDLAIRFGVHRIKISQFVEQLANHKEKAIVNSVMKRITYLKRRDEERSTREENSLFIP